MPARNPKEPIMQKVLLTIVSAAFGGIITYSYKAATLEGRVTAIETSTARIEAMLISIAPELKIRVKEHTQ